MNRRSFFGLLGKWSMLPLVTVPTVALAGTRCAIPEIPESGLAVETRALGFPYRFKPIFRRGLVLDFTVPYTRSNGTTTMALIYDGESWVQLDSWQGDRLLEQLVAELKALKANLEPAI